MLLTIFPVILATLCQRTFSPYSKTQLILQKEPREYLGMRNIENELDIIHIRDICHDIIEAKIKLISS